MDGETEYSDGIEKSALKYEKTDNRDLMKTIERINRSEKFKDSAEDILKLLEPVMTNSAVKAFKEAWRTKNESHENPQGLVFEANVSSPVLRKVHPEGDLDKTFKSGKEYPFYYSVTLNFMFGVNIENAIKSDDSEMRNLRSWFANEVSPMVERKVVEDAKKVLDTKFANIFNFDQSNTVLSRMNISAHVSLSINKSESMSVDVVPFIDSEDIRNGLVSNFAMALERIIR